MPEVSFEEVARARVDLEMIVQLERSKPFQDYFLRRLNEKISAIEARILDESFPLADIPRERAALSTLREISRMCQEEEAGCRTILGEG